MIPGHFLNLDKSDSMVRQQPSLLKKQIENEKAERLAAGKLT